MLNIQKMFIKFNTSVRTKKVEYIVIHDTGNSSKGATALSHYKYFNGENRQASADFFVDDGNIIQTVDYTKNNSWHCGDGHGKYGINNDNSLGIEICINSDGNYAKAFQNAVELAVSLAKELGVPANKIVRHYDASRKNCPATMAANSWAKWTEFKTLVIALLNPVVKAIEKPVEVKEEKPVGDYKTNAVDYLAEKGILSDAAGWKTKTNEPAPVWLIMVIAANIIKMILKK